MSELFHWRKCARPIISSDDFTYINSAGIVDAGGSLKEPPHTILSFFGEARYDYDDRILVTASLRSDGSSNFGANNRFGYFPALSAAWSGKQRRKLIWVWMWVCGMVDYKPC
ncbi:MAG: TonB-dependent receptor [Flammeovirgaceae bacterium]|nr:TonB-dependent receptor [Flammeovirgaceae bacterium]